MACYWVYDINVLLVKYIYMESHHPQQKQKIDENCILDSATMAKMKDIPICSGFPKHPFMVDLQNVSHFKISATLNFGKELVFRRGKI